MNKLVRTLAVSIGFAALFFLSTTAFADSVSLTLTSAGNNVLGGVYVGPYTAVTGTGQTVGIICDDFVDDTFLNESWSATINSFSTLSSARFSGLSNYQNLYNQAAWLAVQMYNPQYASQIGYIQYALWAVFSPSALNSLTGSALQSAQAWLASAQQQTFTTGQFSNVFFYTPIAGTDVCPNFPGGVCPLNSPQEFIYVQVPEGGTAAAYLIGALLMCFGAMYLKPRWQIQ